MTFTAAGETAPDAAELLAALGAQSASDKPDRREAIARFLSNAPDWREARDCCGGAFAPSTDPQG